MSKGGFGGNFCCSHRHKVAAFERIALKFGAATTAHITLQFVDRRRLPAAHDVERDRLVRGLSANNASIASLMSTMS
jgi:hypothetical protein